MAYPEITVENVLPQLLHYIESGQRVCLATLYHSYGTSPRPVGSQMAIAEDGRWYGYLSGGCAEQAIADEGVAAIQAGDNRSVRYGVGSKYLDIYLPCGAGIDIWFDQNISKQAIEQAIEAVAARQTVAIECDTNHKNAVTKVGFMRSADFDEHAFRRWYLPPRRLHIIGAGPSVSALAALANEADYLVEVLTPDQHTLDEVLRYMDKASLLLSHSQIEGLETDSQTSVVLMFHEHERETKILQSLLATKVVYIGALGSTRTHNARLDSLRLCGATSEQCSVIHGPVGLEINAKTPVEIAISVLAELTLEYQRTALSVLDWAGPEISV